MTIKQIPHPSKVKRVEVRHFKVTDADSGRRLDNYLFTHFKNVPKSHLYRVIRSGQVRLNSGRVRPSRRIANGDVIRVPPMIVGTPSLNRISESESQRFKNSVIFEDEYFLVINKPSGVVVHSGTRHNFGLVEISQSLRGETRFPALAHRLDRGTSGCLLLAKSQAALLEAQTVFRLHETKKHYIALVVGKWDENVLQVSRPITIRSGAVGAKVVVDEDKGKPAVTQYKIAQHFNGFTLLDVMPQTGRMHQIRVHSSSCDHPVVGDRQYGNFAINRDLKKLGLQRLFLHAKRLRLDCMGRKYDFQSPLPEDLSTVLEKLESQNF